MAVPVIPGNATLPVNMQMAVQCFWDTTANSGSGGWVPVSGAGAPASGAVITTGDIEIGAVELKNASTDDRASINASGELLVRIAAPSTGTISSVADSATSVTVLASNASRKGAVFFNDSSSVLYLALSNTTASTTVYTVQVPAFGYYELPIVQGGVYTGICVGIWSSDSTGSVRVTELT